MSRSISVTEPLVAYRLLDTLTDLFILGALWLSLAQSLDLAWPVHYRTRSESQFTIIVPSASTRLLAQFAY